MAAKKKSSQIETLDFQQRQFELQVQNVQFFHETVSKILPIAEKYYTAKLTKVEAPKVRWSIVGFLFVLCVVVIVSGILVYTGKMESSNFTFLLGTLVGGSITFLGDIILPSQ